MYGTQNYGITNYDTYAGSTKTYTIPVGNFYYGAMDRLVFINDNDGGTGNNSTISQVKIYEGVCDTSVAQKITFAITKPNLGSEEEGVLPYITISPNPVSNIFNIHVTQKTSNPLTATLYTINGRAIFKQPLSYGVNAFSSKKLQLSAGLYLITLETEGEETVTKKIVLGDI
ncbi:T9SS type A sorting domain-containing protein [Lacinutrix neustonica]|uniref:T9SS type A sorting domain-containing protein n=1 Tax=Lacinutrix neustonica TaxID=2980107 RepID=A0A9E8SFP7_9FLAO|nr:T9SS type A sorting domain-containing protein [Lacinutrix neustonica]WAC00965.1 T9SS type A sorting domain-containing protein [Lacinutrix neustonica]